MSWVKIVVLIGLLIDMGGCFTVSVYYGIVISDSFTDWREPTTIGFNYSCVTVVCGVLYLCLARPKNKSHVLH